MEPKQKNTYPLTYGIAIIILTLVLNDIALYLITGHSVVPLTYLASQSNSYEPMPTPIVHAMPVRPTSSTTSTASSTQAHAIMP